MEELIKKARDGDKDSFVEAIIIIQKDLYNIAYVKLNNIDDVNDVIQETMFKAFKNIKKLKKFKYFKTWVIRILINECNKFYIQKYKRNRINTNYRELDLENTYANDIEKIEIKDELDSIISKLSEKEKIVIYLKFYNNFTIKEIAKILHTNQNTVKTRLRRAEEKINKLRKGDIDND